MFDSREDALDFRDRVTDTLVALGRNHDLIWHVSPRLDGVHVQLPTDGYSQGVVRGRLTKEGFELDDRGATDDGDWNVLEVRPG